MAPSLGNFALWISLLFACLQFATTRKKNKHKFISISVNGLLFFSLLSFFLLTYAHITSDFSVLNVYQNSHSTKPLIYKIAGVWGNHEGSMLLWIIVLTIFNYLIFKLYNKNNFYFISKTLEIQSLIIIGFALFTILTSNPFERLLPVPIDGLGFNPILQDPALAIHPPLLYIGYVGFSAAFSFRTPKPHSCFASSGTRSYQKSFGHTTVPRSFRAACTRAPPSIPTDLDVCVCLPGYRRVF